MLSQTNYDLTTFAAIKSLPGIEVMRARYVHQDFAPHAHAEYGLGVILGGLERFRYRGVEHVAGPGAVIAMNPEAVHTGRPGAEGGWTYAMAYVSVSALSELLGGQTNVKAPVFGTPVIHDPELASALAVLLRSTPSGQDRLTASTRFVAALGPLVSRHAVDGRDAIAEYGDHHSLVRVRDRLEGIADGEAQTPSLSDLAEMTGLTPTRLLRRYAACFGQPPHAHLRDMRLRRARVLLRSGMTAAEAAAAVGFADQSHLTRWFKRTIGTTPAAYAASVVAQ